MDLSWIDWSVVGCFIVFMIYTAYSTKKYAKSSADFLVANRLGGRYLLTMSSGIAGLGAITILGNFQMAYQSGDVAGWFLQFAMFFTIILQMVGWITYRFRETRAMTLAQFFEMRYSRRFRIIAGTICWVSGIVNFGIFPAVTADFFVNFLNLPATYGILGFVIPTYHTLVVILVLIALYFTLTGGQITVMFTDFVQFIFCGVVLVTILGIILYKFPISDWYDGALIAKPTQSRVNPFDAFGIEKYNIWFYIINFICYGVINRMSWQGAQGFQAAGRTPHEQKMAGVLSGYRDTAFLGALWVMPIVAWMIMHLPKYAPMAEQVNALLNTIPNEQVRSQMLVPTTMRLYLPTGLIGAFAVVMLAASIGTSNAYLHSWGSIFIQDVIMPLRKKPFSNKTHMWLLRGSIALVALYIIIFSFFFRQTQDILMFLAMTGAVWMGGAGVVIVGGLYTSWGKTAGAYGALIGGAIVGVAGVVIEQVWYSYYGKNFPINGQWMLFIAMMTGITLYLIFSFTGHRAKFNLDKLLHRGKYAIDSEHPDLAAAESVEKKIFDWRTIFGVTEDFTKSDKFIYIWTYANSWGWMLINLVITITAAVMVWPDRYWANFFMCQRYFWWLPLTGIYIVWLSIGAVRDGIQLFRDLKAVKRDYEDDGFVRDRDDKVQVGDTLSSQEKID